MQCVHNLKCVSVSLLLCRQTVNYRSTTLKSVIRKLPKIYSRGVTSYSKPSFEVNTNVAKDVLLFRHDNPKFFLILHVFSLGQFAFWTYLAHFAFTSLKDIPASEDDSLPWWRKINLGDNKFRIGLTLTCLLIAYGILGASWLFTAKSVKFLVLRKGGQDISLVTYGLFGKSRYTTVSLDKVSCEQSRHSAKVQLPLRIKGHWMYFMLDMRGEFTNPRLFDYTAGLRRKIN
ncbi:transmembrane protein 223 [Anabrus simplex]|uniref:transmembrane protein 223 n=1 Tax=Anabrus simplex TaxID=316456 RepID=UPI0035A34736